MTGYLYAVFTRIAMRCPEDGYHYLIDDLCSRKDMAVVDGIGGERLYIASTSEPMRKDLKCLGA